MFLIFQFRFATFIRERLQLFCALLIRHTFDAFFYVLFEIPRLLLFTDYHLFIPTKYDFKIIKINLY